MAKPLYSQVRDMVLNRIRNGEWKAGETLPNEFVLASQCGVSVGTIRRAVEWLEESGLVVRKQGRGTYVTGFATRAIEQKFCPLLSSNGERLPLDYELDSVNRRRATASDREYLPDMDGSDVLEVRQLLRSSGQTIGVETSLLSAAQFPRLEKQMTAGQHLYTVFSSYGVLVTRAEEKVGLVRADGELSTRLGLDPGAPILHVERCAVAYDDRRVEQRQSFYRPTVMRYGVTID